MLALVPARGDVSRTDVGSADIDWAAGSCQKEDCMPAEGWVCGGRDDKCNLAFEACRKLACDPDEAVENCGISAEHENEDCLPAEGWVCRGRDDFCNPKYAACRRFVESQKHDGR